MKYLIILTLLITTHCAKSQTVIQGTVKTNKGKALKGISVAIKDSYDGGITDSLGNFNFTTTDTGAHTIQFSSVDYEDYEVQVTITKDPVTVNASLKEKLNELKAVTVTAGAFAAGDDKRAATVLNSIDIATTAGSNADITAALKTLPGAQQVGNQEGLFVRGGTGEETKQFIDGTLVNNPYFTSIPDIATRGRFSPFLFKGTVFTTGGYSALYGGALSSALILESIDLPDRSQATASISPIIVGGGFQNLSKKKNWSFGIDYSYVNLVAYFNLVKQTPDYFKMPQFHSGDGNFRIKTKGGIIKYYTTFSYNNLGIRRPDIDSMNMKDALLINNHNWYNNISWRENLGGGWKMNLGAGYSTNLDKVNQQLQDSGNNHKMFAGYPWSIKNFDVHNRQDLTQLRAVFEKKLGGLNAIRFGAEDQYFYNPTKYSNQDSLYDVVLKDNYSAAFAETDLYITNALALKLGGRFEYSTILKKANIAPRISMAYKTGPGAQISLAYGEFYQKPEFNQLVFTKSLGYTKAIHYIANYQVTANQRIFRVEAFYKKYHDLVKSYPTYNNDGTGYAQGLEFFLRDKKTIKGLDYWISYSYLDTKRDYLNYPGQLEPNFAAHHTASIVTKKFVQNWKAGFNLTYTFATGQPYYEFVLDPSGSKYNVADAGRTKDYHNLGFSAEYIPNAGNQNAKTFLVLFASVNNVLGSNQVYGYNYSYNSLNKQPILPPAKRFYFIGCFLSWGVDRSQDAIDNNL